MNEELRAELLERAHRDQAARNSLPPRGSHEEWQTTVAPVDEANTAWLRGVVTAHGWPGHALAGQDGAHAAWLLVQPPWAWNPNTRTAPASWPSTAMPTLGRARTLAVAVD